LKKISSQAKNYFHPHLFFLEKKKQKLEGGKIFDYKNLKFLKRNFKIGKIIFLNN